MQKLLLRQSAKKIRGVRYEVISRFKGDQDIFYKVGEMIKNNFSSVTFDDVANENSVDVDIDKTAT